MQIDAKSHPVTVPLERKEEIKVTKREKSLFLPYQSAIIERLSNN